MRLCNKPLPGGGHCNLLYGHGIECRGDGVNPLTRSERKRAQFALAYGASEEKAREIAERDDWAYPDPPEYVIVHEESSSDQVQTEAKRVFDKAVQKYLRENPGDGSHEDLMLEALEAVYRAGMEAH